MSKEQPKLTVKRVTPYPHYEVHYWTYIEFRSLTGELIKRTEGDPCNIEVKWTEQLRKKLIQEERIKNE